MPVHSQRLQKLCMCVCVCGVGGGGGGVERGEGMGEVIIYECCP